jgi:starch phosphorylase
MDPAVPYSTAAEISAAVLRHARHATGASWEHASNADVYTALAHAIRDAAHDMVLKAEDRAADAGAKRIYYLSIEHLVGRSLASTLRNMGLFNTVRSFLAEQGRDLTAVLEEEIDAALGNGGLGRLAACYQESMATLGLPGYSYGINYEFGMFRQEIRHGAQAERPDVWRQFGSPWLLERPSILQRIPVFGKLAYRTRADGKLLPEWVDFRHILGVPSDLPVVGYGARSASWLRLYAARSEQEFDLEAFNQGDYVRSIGGSLNDTNVSRVLYPDDAKPQGRELRLLQEYFFCACAVRDILRIHDVSGEPIEALPDRVAIQLNDTHPVLAIVELMRILLDERQMDWTPAWEVVCRVFAYTNHTLLPEALEKWTAGLLDFMVPRHLSIIYEINRRYVQSIAQDHPGDAGLLERTAIITGSGPGSVVHMARLAAHAAFRVNGVADLHTRLLQRLVMPDVASMEPTKFTNVTNGITQRRWLLHANPGLAGLVTEAIGDGWVTDLEQMRALEPLADDASFRDRFRQVRRENKQRMADAIERLCCLKVDPESMFDAQVKRMHEYKRQLLNLLRVAADYADILDGVASPGVPRVCIFAGKAAASYFAAKEIIRLIVAVSRVINADPRAQDRLKLVFIPDYRVTLAEKIIPSADLSIQISAAGSEASGTGNMKFALNGALTIGTLDGANIEIRDAVGERNFYLFGLTAEQMTGLTAPGFYDPAEAAVRDPRIQRVLGMLESGFLTPWDPDLGRWVRGYLLSHGERYGHLADMGTYLDAQDRAASDYRDLHAWDRRSILNMARVGRFSSDRAVSEYAERIWRVKPV